jgi:outer membrane receptor protein involved in Fe transport
MGKSLGFIFFSVIMFQFSFGQPGRPGGGGQQMNIGRFYGKVVDSKTNKGMEAVSVQLISSKMDTSLKKRRDTVIAGMFTPKSGNFSFENLPVFGNYRITITAIGYKPVEQKAGFELKMGPGTDMTQAMAAVDKDLGNIKIEADAQVLESVTVTGSKPLMQMGIDRKIFNVEKNITSAGGTGVDVMRNIPSVNVDIDGNVTLRNSAPQIFVDGRPSTLSLEQIPADAIESVELITNPSAKFDASGGQSGILNIVLKKARKVGYNGGLRAGIDSRARVNAGADINIRQGKVNLFANGMYNQRKSKSWGETDRLNLVDNPDVKIFQDNNSVFNGAFAFTRFGLDFFIDNRNTITVSQSIVGGNFDFDNRSNIVYDTLNSSSSIESQYRNTMGRNTFRNYGTMLSFKHLFAKAGKEWTADINFNKSKNTNNSDINFRSFYDMDQQDPKSSAMLQEIDGGGRNTFLTMQTDYVNPINDNMKWEGGLRAQIRTFESRQLNYLNGIYNPLISNNFEYTDYVYAGYLTFSQKIKEKFSYQLGLRAESSQYEGEQIGKAKYTNEFPLSLFPSVFVTKSIGDNQDVQLNYSRRINRPNFFQLMPNTDFSDPLNFQTGNPDLRPEFTNSLELSYQKTYGKKNNTFLATLFGKYTTDLISRYQNRQKVGNSDTTAFVSTWINASTAYAAGLELVFRNNLTKWWELNLNTNVYYSKINGSNVVPDLENERTSSFSKLNNTFKIKTGWSIQLSADYQSKSALPVSTSNSGGGRGGGGGWMGGTPSTTQGYINANYGVDLGFRKDFKIKTNQASISLNINDIFRTRRYYVHSESIGFIQDEWRRRDPQIVRLNFNYRFGKFDASLFKRKNLRSENEGMQNGMQGVQQ